jgi:hypothetical protein
MLYITAPGRCGTSLLAEFARRVGYDPGGKYFPGVESGNEHRGVKKHNVNLLVTEDPAVRRKAFEFIAGLDAAVVKDINLFRHPVLFRAWKYLHPNMRVVLCWRDIESQFASWNRKIDIEEVEGVPCFDGSIRYPPPRRPKTLEKFRRLVQRQYDQFMDAIFKTRTSMVQLDFPKFLCQYHVVHRVFEWGGLPIDWNKGKVIWHNLIDKDKVHFGR